MAWINFVAGRRDSEAVGDCYRSVTGSVAAVRGSVEEFVWHSAQEIVRICSVIDSVAVESVRGCGAVRRGCESVRGSVAVRTSSEAAGKGSVASSAVAGELPVAALTLW